MSVTDLIIIYLACGSPFGVYQITRRQQERSAGSWFAIASSFLVWPVFAVTALVERFVSGGNSSEAATNARIESIRNEIECVAFSGGATASLFEFREVFYRFTGLFEAANTEITAKFSNELFEISGHRNKTLASQCFARRNREKLSYHQTLARNEFADMIADLAGDKAISQEIGRLALELTSHLGDDDATADLLALLPGQSKPETALISDPKKETSKRTPHSLAA